VYGIIKKFSIFLKACDFVALDAKGVSLGEELTGGNKNIFFVKEN
jgi:hypothetical protein